MSDALLVMLFALVTAVALLALFVAAATRVVRGLWPREPDGDGEWTETST
jgi:hypothetical protein